MAKKKRKLTKKQKLAGFGGKRAQSAAKSSRKTTKRKATKAKTTKKKTTKKKSSTSGLGTAITAVISAAGGYAARGVAEWLTAGKPDGVTGLLRYIAMPQSGNSGAAAAVNAASGGAIQGVTGAHLGTVPSGVAAGGLSSAFLAGNVVQSLVKDNGLSNQAAVTQVSAAQWLKENPGSSLADFFRVGEGLKAGVPEYTVLRPVTDFSGGLKT